MNLVNDEKIFRNGKTYSIRIVFLYSIEFGEINVERSLLVPHQLISCIQQ